MGLKIKIQGPESLAKKPIKEVWRLSLRSLKSAAGTLRCGIGACEPGPRASWSCSDARETGPGVLELSSGPGG